MDKAKQIEIMEAQLSNFSTLYEKMFYMANFFDIDPQFSKEARDQVRGNISRELKNATV